MSQPVDQQPTQPSTPQVTAQPYGEQGRYGQQGQYGQAPYQATGAPMSPELERQMVCAAHWSPIASVLLGGFTWIGPLIVLLVGGNRSQAVRKHAVDALNFQITTWIATIAVVLLSLPLMLVLVGFVTIWLAVAVPLVALVMHGIAAVKVAAGEDYRYPFTLHLIK